MKRIFKALAVGSLVLAPMMALAAIDGSHHDMTDYRGVAEKCAYCHAKTGLGTYNNFGQVGSFCVAVCHDGATSGMPGATPTAPGHFGDGTVANRYATVAGTNGIDTVNFATHGNSPIVLGAPDDPAAVAATNWPHSNETTMQCTTCHAVHDSTNTPFLNAPLSTGTNATSFCQRCHTGSAPVAGYAGRYAAIAGMGAHPTEFAYVDGTSVRSGVNADKLSRDLNVKAAKLYQGLAASYTDRAAFDADTTNNTAGTGAWRTGGHFIAANGLPITAANSAALAGATFGCYSCHSAHQSSTGTAANPISSGSLILGSVNAELGAGASTANFCTGCHGLPASVNNPGSTSYYHPANEQAAVTSAGGSNYNGSHEHSTHGATAGLIPNTGSFPIPVVMGGSVPKGTVGNEVLCTSCHDVHGGVAGHMAIRAVEAAVQINGANSKDVCFTCHQASTPVGGSGANSHHQGQGRTKNYTGGDSFPAVANIAWGYPGGYGNLADGLSCPDCHVFQANTTHRATAHNW